MQGGHGRGGGRQGYNVVPGYGMANSYGALGRGLMPGYVFNNWVPYSSNNQMQNFMPAPPVVLRPHGRGSASGAFVPLGVQGAGILKRPSGPSQNQTQHGRWGRNRGHNGRSWGSRHRDRSRKNLTKEALDAELDEYRMKDKKSGGQSLDAELDEYWKRKHGSSNTRPEVAEGNESREEGIIDGEISAGESSLLHKDGDKRSADDSKLKSQLEDP